MKNVILKLIFILFMTCFCFTVSAQTSTTFYDTCNALRQFEGEWRNVNGNDTIKVYFRVQNFYSQPTNTIEGEILGWHEYKHGNTVIESDYAHRFDVIPVNFAQKADVDFSIGLASGIRGSDCDGTLSNLYGGMTDYSKNKKSQNWKITRISQTVIQVYQLQGEQIINITYIPGYTLPQSFLLTKQ